MWLPGPAINASIIDMGNRFRLLVNEVEAVTAFRITAETSGSPGNVETNA